MNLIIHSKFFVLKKISLLVLSFLFISLISCDKETKKFEKESEKNKGTYTLTHYSLQEYDEDTRELTTNIDTDSYTAEFNLSLSEDESPYSLMNEFRFKCSFPLKMMVPIRAKVLPEQNADGTESVYWRPDAATYRLLIFHSKVEGSEYIILTIEDLGKNKYRWTYIESFDGFDGGSLNSLKLKEVFDLEKSK